MTSSFWKGVAIGLILSLPIDYGLYLLYQHHYATGFTNLPVPTHLVCHHLRVVQPNPAICTGIPW